MRMKWKYPVYFGGLVLALAATAVSCSDESTSPSGLAASSDGRHIAQDKVQELQNSYGWMGRYHTEALAYIQTRLSQARPRTSIAEKCRIAARALKEFNKSFSKGDGSKGLADGFLSDDLCDGSVQISASQQVQIDANPELLKPRSVISAQATSLLNQIQNVFNTDVSLPAAKSTIYAIESTAAAILSATEAGGVVGVGSIAISSADYWDANLGVWQSGSGTRPATYNRMSDEALSASVLAGPPAAPRYGLSPLGKRIMKADVSAAISSLLTGWWMGPADLEAAAIRATVASALAGLTT